MIPGYRIVREVGRGGMGVVYEAVEEALGRTVALKVVAPERTGELGFRERFVAESRTAASLDHPNVLPVFGAGETDDGVLWLSMRLVVGSDLRSLAPLPGPRAAAIVAQVGAALDAAHERRLVHRDVKPANVMVTASDHAYLTDFGLVKALDHGSDLTQTGEVVGTLDYIAPERIRGAGDGPAADLYSLGCLLHVALTGRPVFDLEGTERKLWAHLSEPPPAVPGFEAVLARALAKDPADRFESGAALGAAAIAAAASGASAGGTGAGGTGAGGTGAGGTGAGSVGAGGASAGGTGAGGTGGGGAGGIGAGGIGASGAGASGVGANGIGVGAGAGGATASSAAATDPFAAALASARRAAAGSGRERVVAALDDAAAHARRLADSLAAHPPERVEARLLAARTDAEPGKPRRVAALATQLARQRRRGAALDEWEHFLADFADPSLDEITALAARLAAAGGESAT